MFPEWNIWTQFVNDYVARAQDLDGLQSSHPIEVEIYKTEEINEIFDMISYAKGACVIRMVSNFLVSDSFPLLFLDLSINSSIHQFINSSIHQFINSLASIFGSHNSQKTIKREKRTSKRDFRSIWIATSTETR